MPPQQTDGLPDFIDGGFDFRSHVSSLDRETRAEPSRLP
jgi:hypothetical protein